MRVELAKIGMGDSNKLDCLSCGVCCYMPHEIGKSFNGIIIGKDGWCIYCDKDKKCTIYGKRPLVCRKMVSGGQDCLAHRRLYLPKEKDGEQ